MKCPNCGTEVSNDKACFCPNCGTPLNRPAPEPSPYREPEPEVPPVEPPPYRGPEPEPYGAPEEPPMPTPAPPPAPPAAAPAKSIDPEKMKIIIFCAVAAIAILAAIVWRITHSGKKADTDTPTAASSYSESTDAAQPTDSFASSSADSAAPAELPDPAQAAQADSFDASYDYTQSSIGSPNSGQVVLRNVREGASITVDGRPVDYQLVGHDALVSRSSLPDYCQVRTILPLSDGSYTTAALVYNHSYGDDRVLGDRNAVSGSDNNDYGAYTQCDASGCTQPTDDFLHVLMWVYYQSYLNSVNNQDASYLLFSTGDNTRREMENSISTEFNTSHTFDLGNFQHAVDTASVSYTANGTILLNSMLHCYASSRSDSSEKDIVSHRTFELTWQDGMWKVNRCAYLSEDDYNSGKYADLP